MGFRAFCFLWWGFYGAFNFSSGVYLALALVLPGSFCRLLTGPYGFSFLIGFPPPVDDINPALPSGPYTMGIMEDSLLWVMQDLYHQP